MTKVLKVPPPDYEHIGNIYSNFDHELDKKVEDLVSKGNVVAYHTAWNFFAVVWVQGGRWYEMVKQHRQHVDTIEGASAIDVIRITNGKYGSE